MDSLTETYMPETVTQLSQNYNKTNQTSNNTRNFYFQRDENLAKVEIAVQALTVALATFGNGLVLLILIKRRKRLSRMTMLILNLCLADLFVAFFNMFPQLMWDITYTFQGGDFLCKFVKYAQIVAMYASSYVLVMTAIDRYISLVHPLISQTWSNEKVHLMVSIAWGLSLIFSIPQVFIFGMKHNQYGLYDCWATFNPEWTLTAYITWFCFAIYIIPFIILLFCYISICFVVWKSANRREASASVSYKDYGKMLLTGENGAHYKPEDRGPKSRRAPRVNVSKAKVKTVKLTLTVVLCYVICWGPFFISQMWAAWDPNAPFTGKSFELYYF